ncbi:MAG: hypothetical protein JSW73_02690 [Candidatus Woesearchaeota archaeon]|nr:MAG: hypothetical protein JSW73_02690 [Candidatus Woesearchaeota archaeon]
MKKLLLVCVLMIPLLMMNYASAIPSIPHQFYGDVIVNGKPASDGMTITANIGGVDVASTLTSGGNYNLIVPDPLGDRSGDLIKFIVNGKDTGQTAVFQNAKNERLDLSATISTGGGSGGGGSGGGGGGGGGGGSYIPPTSTTSDDETEPQETEDTQPPAIPEPETTTEDVEESTVEVEETETTTDTGEPTIIARITGAVVGTFSSAENAFIGIAIIILIIVGAWFASKKLKKKNAGKSEEK